MVYDVLLFLKVLYPTCTYTTVILKRVGILLFISRQYQAKNNQNSDFKKNIYLVVVASKTTSDCFSY